MSTSSDWHKGRPPLPPVPHPSTNPNVSLRTGLPVSQLAQISDEERKRLLSSEGIDITTPAIQWKWYVFGGRDEEYPLMCVDITHPVTPWRRFISRLFLGSQWERVDAS